MRSSGKIDNKNSGTSSGLKQYPICTSEKTATLLNTKKYCKKLSTNQEEKNVKITRFKEKPHIC